MGSAYTMSVLCLGSTRSCSESTRSWPESRSARSPPVCPSFVSVLSALAAPVASCLGWEEAACPGDGREGGRQGPLGCGPVLPQVYRQIKKAEMDRKTLDWEIVELTNKLLDAKNTINKLEELNVRAPPLPMAGSVAGFVLA